MKKIIALLLIVVMCLAFAACGEKTLTKDEMLVVAEEYSATDIQSDSIENIVSAKQKYCNKTLLLSGMVKDIKENHIELSTGSVFDYIIDVYLATDELVKLQPGQSIQVVGITTDEIIEKKESVAEYTLHHNHYQMPTAYLVQDRVEITGILKGENDSFVPAFNIQIGDSNYHKLIYFADSVDTSTIEYGQKIKFSAKAINKDYYEAEIIEFVK